MKEKHKYFPFSPGIPWLIEKSKYIIPNIDEYVWNTALDGKEFVVTVPFAGALETFFSLCFIEKISATETGRKITYVCHKSLQDFFRLQGLCHSSVVEISQEILDKYPAPIFLDKNNRAYFNVMNNYLVRTSYSGKYSETVPLPVLEQLRRNLFLGEYVPLPKLRNLSTAYDDWVSKHKLKGFKLLFIFNSSIRTLHETKCFDLSNQEIKELSAIMSPKGYRVIVCDDSNVDNFYGTKIIKIERSFDLILSIIKNAFLVMSRDIDWLIIAMMVSQKIRVVLDYPGEHLDPFKNADVIGLENVIFMDRQKMTVMDIVVACEE